MPWEIRRDQFPEFFSVAQRRQIRVGQQVLRPVEPIAERVLQRVQRGVRLPGQGQYAGQVVVGAGRFGVEQQGPALQFFGGGQVAAAMESLAQAQVGSGAPGAELNGGQTRLDGFAVVALRRQHGAQVGVRDAPARRFRKKIKTGWNNC